MAPQIQGAPQGGQSIPPTDQSTQAYNNPQVAEQAKNMTKAIFQTESGGNWNAKGKSGESGAGQWTSNTWKSQAQDVLGNANAGMTPENQSIVAQGTIRKLIVQGKNAAQISAIWNSGSDQNWENKVGTNNYGVQYNVPKYVKSVTDAYQKIKNGGQVQADPQNPSSVANTDPQTQPQDQSPSVGGFLSNAIGSAGSLIGGIGNAIMHPIDTAKNLGETAFGGLESGANLFGGKFDDQNTQKFSQLANFYNQRYGVSDLLSGKFNSAFDKIGNTLYKDPVGAALDASMLLGGAGGAIGKIGDVAGVDSAANIGEKISKIGSAIDPVQAAGNLAGNFFNKAGRVGGEVLGQTTGVGYNPIHEAVTNPSEALTSAMRGNTTGDQILEQAKSGLEDLRQTRSATYQQDLANLKSANPGSLDISPIESGIKKQISSFGITENTDGTLDFSRSSISQGGQRSVQEAVDMLNSWGTRPGDRTAAGLNILQQKLGDIIPESGKARAFITPLQAQVKDLLDTIPGAKEMRTKYAQSSQFIDDINRSFMSGNTETAIKKLTSLTRRNNPFKLQLAKELESATGVNLTGAAAGTEFSQAMPRGLVAPTGGIAELGASFIHPAFLAALPFSSPRVVGELMSALGYTRAKALSVLSGLQKIGATSALSVAQRVNASQGQKKQQQQSPQSLLQGYLQTANR